MTDLILSECEVMKLTLFEWNITDLDTLNNQRVYEKLKKCKSIRCIRLSTSFYRSTENDEYINSIDFAQIVSLCLDAKKIERIKIQAFALTHFTRSNLDALLLGVKDYPASFRMSIVYRDYAIERVVQEIRNETIGERDLFNKIKFKYIAL